MIRRRQRPDGDIRMPESVVWAVVLISTVPAIMELSGVGFGITGTRPGGLDSTAGSNLIGGQEAHLLIEWTGFCVASVTAVLALLHFRIRQDMATAVIGIALFCAGALDALRILAALGVVEKAQDPTEFLPFSWVVTRMYNALLLVFGVGLFLTPRIKRSKGDIAFSLLMCIVFLVLAYTIIHIMASSDRLPKTAIAGTWATRPYDLAPLALYLIAGVIIFPRFHRQEPTIFSHALILTAIPAIGAQLHMALGSREVFDAHFNIAHFLKLITYVVPLIGLCLEYMRLQELLDQERQEREQAEQELAERADELARSNADLERFAYVASHDLQEPLRMVSSYVQLLERRYGEKLDDRAQEFIGFAVEGVGRMQQLIHGLLTYSRLDRTESNYEVVDLNEVYETLRANFSAAIAEDNVTLSCDELPNVYGDSMLLSQVLQNLVGNGIKFRAEEPPAVHIGAVDQGDMWRLSVTDNGIGISPEYADKIFVVFQRLHSREHYQGTGIGLSICKKIVELHGGRIWVEPVPQGTGSQFLFTIPKMEASEDGGTKPEQTD
ncbi:MAG: hypothetical protein CMH54_05240 [Myxococcales bacterium]|nr:hypothetical protein [Myxococcales bacterium]